MPVPATSVPSRAAVVAALARIVDPEVGIGIVDLGLLYAVEVGAGVVRVVMTMTSASCPLSESIEREAREAVAAIAPAGTRVEVGFAWDPPWTPDFMSDAARARLGWRGRRP